MLKKILTLFVFFIVEINSVYADLGISLGATRLIYTSDLKQASVNVINSDNRPFLIQSWVTASPNSNKKEDSLFITTPPLFRLESDSTNTVRVIFVGKNLPLDRESVYWLNIKAIPSATKSDDNKLVIAIKSKIKLFYRPLGIKGDPIEAYKAVTFSEKNGKLVITNPTAYNVSFSNIIVNGTELNELVMVQPFSDLKINKKVMVGQTVKWGAVSDYGGTLPELTAKIIK